MPAGSLPCLLYSKSYQHHLSRCAFAGAEPAFWFKIYSSEIAIDNREVYEFARGCACGRQDAACFSKTKLDLDNLEVLRHATCSDLDLLALAARLAHLASAISLKQPRNRTPAEQYAILFKGILTAWERGPFGRPYSVPCAPGLYISSFGQVHF